MRLPVSQRTDLAVVSALSLLALISIALPLGDWLKVVAGVLLVFVLPGYAIAAAIFLPGDIRRDLRVVLTVVFSIACSALGGLALQIVLRLNRPVFATLLLGVTGACMLVAARRRAEAGPTDDAAPMRLLLPGIPSVLALLAAIAIGGWAIAIATAGQHRQFEREHFTALWMLPEATPGSNPPGAPLRVSVANHEGKRIFYTLRVRQGGKTIRRWHLDLPASHQWSSTVPAPKPAGGVPVVAQLLRDGRIYRRVALRPGKGE